jgi:hypothetical protein
MSDLERRVEKLERLRPVVMPPLIICENLTTETKQRIEEDWIRKHGQPGPLFITCRQEQIR